MSKSFAAACREFFGLRPGTGLSDFAAELKALTIDDKKDIAAGLRAIGMDVEEPRS